MRQIVGSDLVVLSKFGKLEAMGSGLVGAFAAAVEAGRPVLTSVSDKHRSAWDAFAPGAASLPASEAALLDWWRRWAPGKSAVDFNGLAKVSLH